MKLIPVILSGGVGSRLWPISRESHPKPFITLPDGDSLLIKTLRRACALENVVEILTVTQHELFFKTEDEYQKEPSLNVPCHYLLEPVGRNTTAAIAAAALSVAARYGQEAQILVLPADHLIPEQAQFVQQVAQAQQIAAQGRHVTFGIRPSAAETGFGYIKADLDHPIVSGFKVAEFIEKPSLERAQQLLNSGQYYWNSGLFCFNVGALLQDLAQHATALLRHVEQALQLAADSALSSQVTKLNAQHFALADNLSIDYALMEKSELVAVLPCELSWQDLGSWSALSALLPSDEAGNRLLGEVLLHDASNNYVQSEARVAALVGVQDLIVVDTADALLITHQSSSQGVKEIVSMLKARGHSAYQQHRTGNRPWGSFCVLEEGDGFKIKRIVVKPGASLSLQLHHHRSEHWVVVSGTARVVNDDQVLLLATNESTFIRAGHRHRLENPGAVDLVLIEVQSGSYLGEDDIVRFEDRYGRHDSCC